MSACVYFPLGYIGTLYPLKAHLPLLLSEACSGGQRFCVPPFPMSSSLEGTCVCVFVTDGCPALSAFLTQLWLLWHSWRSEATVISDIHSLVLWVGLPTRLNVLRAGTFLLRPVSLWVRAVKGLGHCFPWFAFSWTTYCQAYSTSQLSEDWRAFPGGFWLAAMLVLGEDGGSQRRAFCFVSLGSYALPSYLFVCFMRYRFWMTAHSNHFPSVYCYPLQCCLSSEAACLCL